MTTKELTKRVDTIDERLDRLATDVEGLKDSQMLMRENVKDVLFSIELLGERTNQMIDAINRHEAAIERNATAIERNAVAIDKLAAAQARTDEALQNLALKQAQTAESVDHLSKTVDRYLNARLNGKN